MKLSLNSKVIDSILGGGLDQGVITNIYGPPGSGKTNFCLQASVACIASGKKVVFVDTEGGFSLERFHQLTQSDPKNIFLLEPKSFREQKEAMNKAARIAEKQEVGLIVIDSMVALYRLELGDDKIGEVNREMSRQLALLSKIAREQKIPVMITTQIYESGEDKERKIELTGGYLTKWWGKVLIELQRTERANHRVAILRKHLHLPEGLEAEFVITNSGLEDAKKFGLF